MTVKHATASVFVFGAARGGWRLGLIEHPRLGCLMLPGGHVETDESQAEAALREVGEETGLAGVVLLPVPAPALPAGFPHERVPSPWWITEQQVPADNHLGEPHVHLDHEYVAVAEVMEPAHPAAHPFGWYALEQLREPLMCQDTWLLAGPLFSCVGDLAAGRLTGASVLRLFAAAAAS